MYRVRNVERHRYRKIPRGNSPSVGEHNAACGNTQRRRVRTTWIVALGGDRGECIAHQRRGSWQTGRLSVVGRAGRTRHGRLRSSKSVPQPPGTRGAQRPRLAAAASPDQQKKAYLPYLLLLTRLGA